MDNRHRTDNPLSNNLRGTDNLLLMAILRLNKGMDSLLSRAVTDSLNRGTRDNLNRVTRDNLNRGIRDSLNRATLAKPPWEEAQPPTSVTSSKFSLRLFKM
jgi:hypothetical protein